MNEILKEYGGTVIASMATLAFLALIGNVIFAENGMLSALVSVWQNGGC